MMVEVKFYNCDHVDETAPDYVIIGARYNGQWVFVKNRKRGTYEMPAGHIDKGESELTAAGRELMEETGALKFVLECLNTYSVEHNESRKTGKLFYANILEIGEIEDKEEIEDRIFASDLPDDLTFPEVQGKLFLKLNAFCSNF
jgi:8-oxo-dGTP diphosphatase